MYAFVGVETGTLPDFDDQQFTLDLLEQKHVLVAPGVSFNVRTVNHFRSPTPRCGHAAGCLRGIEELLAAYAAGRPRVGRTRARRATV